MWDEFKRPFPLIDISLKDDTCSPAHVSRELHNDLLEHRTISVAACTRDAFTILTRSDSRFSGLVAVVWNGQNILTTGHRHEFSRIVVLMDGPAYTVTPAHDKTRSVAGYNVGITGTSIVC